MRWLLAVAEWKKLWHYLVFRQIWIDPGNPDWSNGANEFALCLRKDLEERYLTIERQELLPKRPDIPRYP